MLSAFHVDIPCEGGAVVPLADAVQQVDLDLARAMLHAKARPMGFPRQAVATDGNDFGLTARISRFLHLPLVATGCARSAPYRLRASLSLLATRPDGVARVSGAAPRSPSLECLTYVSWENMSFPLAVVSGSCCRTSQCSMILPSSLTR